MLIYLKSCLYFHPLLLPRHSHQLETIMGDDYCEYVWGHEHAMQRLLNMVSILFSIQLSSLLPLSPTPAPHQTPPSILSKSLLLREAGNNSSDEGSIFLAMAVLGRCYRVTKYALQSLWRMALIILVWLLPCKLLMINVGLYELKGQQVKSSQ